MKNTSRINDYYRYSEEIKTVGRLSNAERKAYADKFIMIHLNPDRFLIVKSMERENVIYYALKDKINNTVRAAVVPTSVISYKQTKIFRYDIIWEEMGPTYYQCPKKILRLLTSTENTYAFEWRILCISMSKYYISETCKIFNAAKMPFSP